MKNQAVLIVLYARRSTFVVQPRVNTVNPDFLIKDVLQPVSHVDDAC
jgi:hypothetical protein